MNAGSRRVLQVAGWYPPYHLGGTEVYLEGLVGELGALGIESCVLVPRHDDACDIPSNHLHAGTPVETYPVNAVPTPDEMREARPHLSFDEFRTRLMAHRGRIYHQHTWSRGCGPHHLRAARELGFKTVLTVHIPGNICLRGTMLQYGAQPCDGRIEDRRCGSCWAQGRGLPRVAAAAVAGLPLPIAQHARHGRTRIATALAARALGAEQHGRLEEMVRNADRIIAVCQWLYDALAINGAPKEKLALSRQGIPANFLGAARAARAERRRCDSDLLKLVYIGRWHPTKGVDLVVRAVRALPAEAKVQLTLHGLSGGTDEIAYERQIRTQADGDPRLVFAPSLSRNEVAATMAQHDALVVPSVWLETGPLVVLEAQATGLYVVGSRLGGIGELVADGADGELVEAGSVRAWAAAIERLGHRRANGCLSVGQRAVRTMATVATEMAEIYASL
jgi:glycosyltransferase involved in cell wall biosynthesis